MHHLFSNPSLTFTHAYDGAGCLEAEHANAAGWLWSAGGQTQNRNFSSSDAVRAGEPTNVQNQYGAVSHTTGSSTTNYTLSYDTSDNLSGDGTRSFKMCLSRFLLSRFLPATTRTGGVAVRASASIWLAKAGPQPRRSSAVGSRRAGVPPGRKAE
ncbi:hypothetical protein [Maricaulis maris]|uniref:hypothetical protein n=1 Tax=Maricaulis maris TaxID=74318 RepID=UPI002925014A|nr:hypothetical protein MACH15_29930 [Maricaulis maris]